MRQESSPKHRELALLQTNDNGANVFCLLCISVQHSQRDMGGWAEWVAPTAFTRTLPENPMFLCSIRRHRRCLGRTTSNT